MFGGFFCSIDFYRPGFESCLAKIVIPARRELILFGKIGVLHFAKQYLNSCTGRKIQIRITFCQTIFPAEHGISARKIP